METKVRFKKWIKDALKWYKKIKINLIQIQNHNDFKRYIRYRLFLYVGEGLYYYSNLPDLPEKGLNHYFDEEIFLILIILLKTNIDLYN